MFNFFRKEKAKSDNIGSFSSYGMEDVFHFLTEKRVNEKIKALSDTPTLGSRLEDLVSQDLVAWPSGELYFLRLLLGYFRNDLDLTIFLYEKSKSFSESNYPQKKSLKEVVERHSESMKRLAAKHPEKRETYLLCRRPIFWLEYDLFYFEVLKSLIYNYNLKRLSLINLEGDYERKGSRITYENLEFVYRSNRKPKTGHYLTMKSNFLLNDIRFDLTGTTEDNVYFFDTLFASYSIFIDENKAIINKREHFSGRQIELVSSCDILGIMKEIINGYLGNLKKNNK